MENCQQQAFQNAGLLVERCTYMKDLLTRSQVLNLLFASWTPPVQTEEIPLNEALGRIAAKSYMAQYNIPVVRASAMDGVAVRSADFANGLPDTTGWKQGEDFIRADTGDDFDDRFDTVIRIEDVDLSPDGLLHIHEDVVVEPGMNVRGTGSMQKQGAPLLTPGLPLRATDLTALAIGGYAQVSVRRRPRVAFLPTGSELLPVGTPLTRGSNYNSNALMASGMLQEMGAEVYCHPIVKDDPEQLQQALRELLSQSDIVIINGGSSKGDEDFNTHLLAKEGKLLFHGVAAGPGRPMSIAMIDNKPVVNLPGPSLAAFYGLDWCIRPMVCRFLDIPVPQRQRVKGRLLSDMSGARPMDFLHRVQVYRDGDSFVIHPLSRSTDNLSELLQSNAMFISPIGVGTYSAGTEIEVELLRNISQLPVWEGEN